MGQPDIAATLTAVAREALNAVWYRKWYVHLRHRPESGSAIVYLQQIGEGNMIQGHVSGTVLGSKAVQSAFATNNSYFLSQDPGPERNAPFVTPEKGPSWRSIYR